MSDLRYFLGIDTSNYTTSVALIDNNKTIVKDNRILLKVREGNRGLRQQEAVFQHTNNLPILVEETIKDIDKSKIAAICVSEKPRNVKDSYMPCFLSGSSCAKVVSSSLDIPLYYTTHQRGHLKAACINTSFQEMKSYIFCHLSGGTCEIIDVSGDELSIKGGSLDISFGQLLDRFGVKNGFPFPCGKKLDEIAINTSNKDSMLTDIKTKDGWFNLSGIETQILKQEYKPETVKELFEKITKALAVSVTNVCDASRKYSVLFAGGVSSSIYIRTNIGKYLTAIDYEFGKSELCSDNAVGVAYIGEELWLQNQ